MPKYQTTDKIINQIYQTDDYSKFILPSYSRQTTDSRVKSLTKSIQKFDISVTPIEVHPVKNKLLIVDGQARFQALKKLQMSIPYVVTNDKNYQSTIYLDQRNAVRSWTTLDRIVSYANNDHNFANKKFQKQVQQEYRNLYALIQETNAILGQVPILSMVQQIQGVNSTIDQTIDPQSIDYKLGLFEVKNAKQYILTIRRFKQLMSQIPYIKISSSIFKSMFVLLADDATSVNYFAWLINHQHDQFQLIATQHDSKDMLIQFISFYNNNIATWKKRGPKPHPISATIGRTGKIKMSGKKFHNELFL